MGFALCNAAAGLGPSHRQVSGSAKVAQQRVASWPAAGGAPLRRVREDPRVLWPTRHFDLLCRPRIALTPIQRTSRQGTGARAWRAASTSRGRPPRLLAVVTVSRADLRAAIRAVGATFALATHPPLPRRPSCSSGAALQTGRADSARTDGRRPGRRAGRGAGAPAAAPACRLLPPAAARPWQPSSSALLLPCRGSWRLFAAWHLRQRHLHIAAACATPPRPPQPARPWSRRNPRPSPLPRLSPGRHCPRRSTAR